MKVLTIFVDMIRANRLSTFNREKSNKTPLDYAFEELGGTVYSNCFTPGPDTPRGMSSFLTGNDPFINGCNTRLKWPQFFLNKNQKSIFDIFLENDYKIDSFSSPQERENGLFPENVANMDIHNDEYDLSDFLSKIELDKKHFIFLSLADFHSAFDDYGYNTNGEKKAYDLVKKSYDKIFEKFDKNDFDHIFIFSDHGFKFSLERKLQPDELLLNEDRTNCILLHRMKYQEELDVNDKLCSLSDFYATYQDILNLDIERGFSFLSNKEREFVFIEEHLDFLPQLNQNIELWAVVSKKSIYLRTLSKCFLIDRASGKLNLTQIKRYENYLLKNTSFKKYIDEYDKIFSYKKNILAKKNYASGKTRKPKSKYYVYFFTLIDYLKIYILKFK